MYNPCLEYYQGPSDRCRTHSFWRSPNPKLAAFGQRHRLQAGDNWILLNKADTAFCLHFAADSYEHMSKIVEVNSACVKMWHEFVVHLLQVDSCLHHLGSRDEVAEILGIKLERTSYVLTE